MITASLPLSLKLGFRNTLRNPRRSLLTLLAICVGVLSTLALAALGRGMTNRLIENAIANLTGHVQIHAANYLEDPDIEHSFRAPTNIAQAIQQQTDTAIWSDRLRIPAVILSERESTGLTIVGINPQKEEALSFYGDFKLDGERLESARDNGIVIGKALAEQLRTDLGKRIVIMSKDTNNEVADRGFRIIGIFKADLEVTEKSFAFVGKETLANMLASGDKISEISIRIHDREQVEQYVEYLSAELPELKIQSWTSLQPLVVAMVKIQDGFLILWNIIVIIAISFGLVNTLFMSIMERIKELGLLQALGMKPALIIKQIIAESFLILLAGCALGNAIAYSLLIYFRDGIDLSNFAKGAEMSGLGSTLYLNLIPYDLIVSNSMIIFLCLISSLYPAYKAAKLTPVEALRST